MTACGHNRIGGEAGATFMVGSSVLMHKYGNYAL